MSATVEASVLYGYDLGGAADWLVTGPSPILRLMNEEFHKYVTQQARRAGTTLHELGITLVEYGDTAVDPRWGLAASKQFTAYDHAAVDLSFITEPRPPSWDTSLAKALHLTPTQQSPTWLVAAACI
ncbi:hypothetical protein [Actinomadura violacea]|uniref:Uncharacterized protein n=1 Tax=Actinomadura violacea TaxID=2819934 RepID=A0ABS3S8E2_9ACTN|nr:hypothetical protein [Actinomadura violacea]MBO2464500.1 hypothetical protein [Actinomadura violacea]